MMMVMMIMIRKKCKVMTGNDEHTKEEEKGRGSAYMLILLEILLKVM